MFNTIQRRLTLLITTLLLLIFAVIYFIQRESYKTADYIAKLEGEKLSSLLKGSIDASGKRQFQFNYDYSYWGEMVSFTKTLDPEWAKINLEEPISTYGYTSAYVINVDFKQIYSTTKKNHDELDKFFISPSELKNILKKTWFPHFFYNTNQGITEVFISPIQPSEDVERTSTPQGWLITTRLFDQNYLDEIKNLTYSDSVSVIAELDSLNIITRRATEEKVIWAAYPFLNWNNSQSGYLLVLNNNLALNEYLNSISNYIPTILIVALLILIIISVWIHLNIGKSISLLASALSTGSMVHLGEVMSSRTEFGALAKLIRDYFEQQNKLREEVKVREATERELLKIKSSLEDRVSERTKELIITTSQIEHEKNQTKLYLDNAGAIICLLDHEGEIKLINKKGLEILGYNDDELIGKNWFNILVPPEEKQERFDNHRNSFQKTIINYGIIRSIITKDQKKKILLFTENYSLPLINDELIMLFSATDVTELKNIESDLRNEKIRVEELQKTQQNFFANMSHELRTPLFGILGYSQMLLEKTSDETLLRMGEVINKSGKRLLDTLNKVLNLSKIESKLYIPSASLFDLVELIEETYNLFKPEAEKKNLLLTFNHTFEKWEINSDRTMIRDIFNNLVHNAIKFTDSGSITIEAEFFDNYSNIRVIDTGIGIPEKSQSLIFEQFRQVSEGFGRSFEGTGLGLAITHKYINLLGGKISIISKENEGSTFSVVLPRDL
jgi:PAS domain S-box-containing protein